MKALTNHQYDYRLRVGSYRVMFDVVNDNVEIVMIQEVKSAMKAHTNHEVIEHRRSYQE